VKIRHSPAAVCGYKNDRHPDNRGVQSHEELSPEGVVQGLKPQSQKPGRMPRVNGLLPGEVNLEALFDAFAGRIGGSATGAYFSGRRFSTRLP
jgi:hypothetical protein